MKKLLTVFQMIRLEHTVFALPFAFLGAFLAAPGFPGWEKSLWILVAMFAARSAAMAFNRLVDRVYDSRNPRTASRPLPRRILSPCFVAGFVALNSVVFISAAWMLNSLAFFLSPLALAIVFLYSYSKRITSLSHLILGLALAIAPVGGWIAVTGEVSFVAFCLAAAVVFWVGGFDIIYACQDYGFDREAGLFSIPSRLGIRKALRISAAFHMVAIIFLIWAFLVFGLSALSWTGLALVVLGLVYEHRLVKPDDLSRVNVAFFAVNGWISVLLCLLVGLDLWLFV